MPYFKDVTGALHFLDDVRFTHLLPEGSVAISDEEATAQNAPVLADEIATLIRQIDSDADAIYSAALGNRATEYAEAEAQAQAFKDSSYAGEAPAYVQAWADATGKTAQWAADDILATAAAWRAAQTSIRVNRLARKEGARKAGSAADIDVVKAEWSAFVVAIKAQLGLV